MLWIDCKEFMFFSEKIKSVLFFRDPGYLHLKHASKTVLAFILTVLGCHFLFPQAVVVAPFMVCFLMQIHQGAGRAEQMKTACLAYPLFMLAFILGAFLRYYPHVYSEIILVLLGFFAFYLQGFGPRFSLFPVFSWVMYFLSVILPFSMVTAIRQNILGMSLGCVIVFVVYFYIYPRTSERIFFDAYKFYVTTCRKALVWLLTYYQRSVNAEVFVQGIQDRLLPIRELLVLSFPLFQSIQKNCPAEAAFVQENFFDECERARGLTMIFEASKRIAQEKIELSEALTQDILEMLDFYEKGLGSVRVDLKHGEIHSAIDVQVLRALAERFKKNILAAPLAEDKVIHVWMLYLGLIQLSRFLRKDHVHFS